MEKQSLIFTLIYYESYFFMEWFATSLASRNFPNQRFKKSMLILHYNTMRPFCPCRVAHAVLQSEHGMAGVLFFFKKIFLIFFCSNFVSGPLTYFSPPKKIIEICFQNVLEIFSRNSLEKKWIFFFKFFLGIFFVRI